MCFFFSGLALCIRSLWIFFRSQQPDGWFFCVFLYIFHEFVIRLDNMYQVHTFLVNFVLYSYLYHVAMTFSSFAANYHRRWDRNNPTDAMAAGWRRQKRGHVNKLCLVAKKLSQKKNMKHPILHVVLCKMYVFWIVWIQNASEIPLLLFKRKEIWIFKWVVRFYLTSHDLMETMRFCISVTRTSISTLRALQRLLGYTVDHWLGSVVSWWWTIHYYSSPSTCTVVIGWWNL